MIFSLELVRNLKDRGYFQRLESERKVDDKIECRGVNWNQQPQDTHK